MAKNYLRILKETMLGIESKEESKNNTEVIEMLHDILEKAIIEKDMDTVRSILENFKKLGEGSKDV